MYVCVYVFMHRWYRCVHVIVYVWKLEDILGYHFLPFHLFETGSLCCLLLHPLSRLTHKLPGILLPFPVGSLRLQMHITHLALYRFWELELAWQILYPLSHLSSSIWYF